MMLTSSARPKQHAVQMSTVPLAEAPKSAQLALSLLEERTRAILGDEPPLGQRSRTERTVNDSKLKPYFNELYPVRYVDSQRMSE